MIDVIIFSRDRACQVDLLLRSIKDFDYKFNTITLLYNTSDDKQNEGFELLKQYHPEGIIYKKENSFHNDFLNTVNDCKEDYILCMCDDDVFIRKNNLETILSRYREDPLVHAASLKLGKNINYCYTHDIPDNFDDFITDIDQVIKWNWLRLNRRSEWGFAFCINGVIYNRNYFKELLYNKFYKAPNSLESAVNHNNRFTKPYMLAFSQSTSLNIPINLVNTEYDNKAGSTFNLSAEYLNEQFLSGKIVSTKNIYGINNNAPHTEIQYEFENR